MVKMLQGKNPNGVLLKISFIISITGIVAIMLISDSLNPNNYPLVKASLTNRETQLVRIKARVLNIHNYKTKSLIRLEVKQNITAIIFEDRIRAMVKSDSYIILLGRFNGDKFIVEDAEAVGD